MKRSALLTLLVATVVVWGSEQVAAATFSRLISQPTAAMHGLTRAWFSQVQLDSARGRISHITLDRGTLFIQTSQAVVHAIDAETGKTLWVEPVGRSGHPSQAPGANEYLISVVNGSTLYLVNRFNGETLWSTQLPAPPGAGAALSAHRVYVPAMNGMVYSYPLHPAEDPLEELGLSTEPQNEAERQAADIERHNTFRLRGGYVRPLSTQSSGQTFVQPVVTREYNKEEFVAWTTDRGYLYVSCILQYEEDLFPIRYKLETKAPIVSQPTCLRYDPKVPGTGIIIAASKDGIVHALKEQDGTQLWHFSTGEPMVEPAVVVGWNIYPTTQLGGMFCLDAKTGKAKWWAPHVTKFLSVSHDKIYAVDGLNRLVILDAKSGSRFDAIPIPNLPIRLTNIVSDRIYLASESGLIQCLHEINQTEPIQHVTSISKTEKEQPGPKKEAPKEPEKSPEVDPFNAENPFNNADGKPEDEPVADPFDPLGGDENKAEDEKEAEDLFGIDPDKEDNSDPFSNPF